MANPLANTTEPTLVLREDRGAVCHLTLNRPEQYNALSEEMLAALQHALDDLADDPAIRVVVLGGAGKAFCAGHDLRQMRARPDQEYYELLFRVCSAVMQSITSLPQPVIARVHGIATAAGCQLVAACDLAVASSAARFAVSGVNLGLFCSTPGVALSRNVPRKRALEMLLTGRFIDADTAARYDLINEVVAPNELDHAVEQLAAEIAAKPRAALKLGKALFYRQIEQGLSTAYNSATDTMACNMMDADAVEGIDAFLEKRAPNWRS